MKNGDCQRKSLKKSPRIANKITKKVDFLSKIHNFIDPKNVDFTVFRIEKLLKIFLGICLKNKFVEKTGTEIKALPVCEKKITWNFSEISSFIS